MHTTKQGNGSLCLVYSACSIRFGNRYHVPDLRKQILKSLLVHINYEGKKCANSLRLGSIGYMQEVLLANTYKSICITLVTYSIIIFKHILSLHLPKLINLII
jgi:hypothetical protein